MRDVARAAGVSVSAVPLVLANKPGVGDERRQRIRAAIERLGYRQDGRQRRLQRRRLGLVIEAMQVPIFADIVYGEVMAGIQEEAQRLGFSVWLHNFDVTTERIGDVTRVARNEVDGLIVANGGDITDERITELAGAGLPLVLVDNHVIGQALHSIVADNLGAGYLATRHLVELGHRRIGVLPGSRRYRNLVDRLDGHLGALREAGIEPDPCLMPPPIEHEERKGEGQMRALLALCEPPTAVVAISDKTAFGALAVLHRAGLRVPEEVSLASIGDVADARSTLPPLTTVAIPRHEMGKLAVRRLRDLLDGRLSAPHKVVLYTGLVRRESTAPPGRSASSSSGDL
jgi:DNA-binding LacI/PurR family transcriptional regulator